MPQAGVGTEPPGAGARIKWWGGEAGRETAEGMRGKGAAVGRWRGAEAAGDRQQLLTPPTASYLIPR